MYETFEHTADLGLRIRAPDLDALFRESAEALFSAIVEPRPAGRPDDRRTIEIRGERLDWLLFDWLSELLFVSERDRVVLGALEVAVRGGESSWRLAATVGAWALEGPGRRTLHEVKAITYHALRVERDGDAWVAEVIVDI